MPLPDPTEQTVRLVWREIAAVSDKFEARLDGMDRATLVLSESVTRVPTTLDREIEKVAALTNEKFKSVQLQISERDAWKLESEGAQQLAVTKSETTFAKQIESITGLLAANNLALNDKIAALTGRLDRSEGRNTGIGSTIALGVSVLAVLVSVVSATGALRPAAAPVEISAPQSRIVP